MALWYDCGNGWLKTRGLARCNLGADAYLCCPGPSLSPVDASTLCGPGRMVFAVTTAYPAVRPDVWIGTDVPECYDRRLWAEPFLKIVRGTYHNRSCQGRPLREFPRVLFADLDSAPVCEMLNRRGHDTAFLWNRNTFTTALHMMIWMGARRVFLVGCDFGGAGDYHDGRRLSSPQRKSNRQLYANLVNDLRRLAPAAKARGIEIVSCTPGSPVNEFLPFLALPEALKRSESEAPDARAPVLHAADAELCQWKNANPSGQGVMVSLDAECEWLGPWWLEQFRQHNSLPVAFADCGMTEAMRNWCKDHGQTIDVTDVRVPKTCLRKPFGILRTPFEMTLFLAPHCQVRGAIEPLFNRLGEGIGLTLANGKAGAAGGTVGAPTEIAAWDTAVIAVRHGHPLMSDWAAETMAIGDRYEGDCDALVNVVARCGYAVDAIPSSLVADGCNPTSDKAAIVRRLSEEEREALKDRLCAVSGPQVAPSAQTAPGLPRWTSQPTDDLGVIVPVHRSQQDLLPWWWWAYARFNAWPVAFADFGMDDQTRCWCQARGKVVPHGAPEGVDGRFRKPFALLQSPFRQTVWTDLDCEVRADVSAIVSLCGSRLGLGRDWSYPQALANRLPFKGQCWSSAVMVFPHGEPLAVEWARRTLQRREGFRGDQEILSSILNESTHDRFAEIPLDLIRSRQEGEDDGLTAVHWSGPGGKAAIRRAWAAMRNGLCADMRSAFWHDWAQPKPTLDRGIIIGVDEGQEWLLNWWWSNYAQHNRLPVHVVDFGMSASARRWCAKRGTLSEPISLGCHVWFKKPLALLRSPFRQAVWLDMDCEVRGPLDRLFGFCSDNGLGAALDRGTPQPLREAMPHDAPIYNGGVLAFNHGDPAVPQWASMTLALRSDRPGDASQGQPSDQETLALVLRRYAQGRVRAIPRDLVRLRLSDGDGPALIMHWTGPVGKKHIREVAPLKCTGEAALS